MWYWARQSQAMYYQFQTKPRNVVLCVSKPSYEYYYFNSTLGTSVPKSCCKDNNLEYVDCGENIFYERPNEIRRRIFTTGCIEKLKKMFRDDSFIYWLMIGYAILSLFMVISQLLTVILTFCYISMIRYVQEESQFQTVFSSDL